MHRLNSCNLEFKFEFGLVDGRYMQTTIQVNSTEYTVIPNNSCFNTKQLVVDLPTQVVLKFTGKNTDTDTIVDNNGQIIKDMFVKIISISLDGFILPEKFLHQQLILVTDTGQQINSAYIGFNGKLVIDMPQKTVFLQYLSMNS